MPTVITVENLSKKYTISHRQRGEYVNLRDALASGLSYFGSKLLHPFKRPQNLAAASENFWALKDVSFQVKQGECLGIIGGNGAGKSTLLKILSRITEPSTGSIRIRGRVASLLEVGTGFHPELTGRENIYLNGAILGMSKQEIRKKFDEIVDFSEIEKFLDTPVKRYSSGMYVRLAFAVAANLDPEILIVDEVLAVGDSQFQTKCLNKMKSVVSSGQTVLFVSHNLGVVGKLCNRSILLDRGVIKSQGKTGEVVEAYLSAGVNTLSQGADLSKLTPSMSDQYFVPEKVDVFCLGRPTTFLEMGSSFQIVLHYSQKTPSKFLKLGFHILDSGGNLICVLSPNQQHPEFTTSLKKVGTISCTVPSLSLITGNYYVSLHYEIPGVSKARIIEKVAILQVMDKDVYGTGVTPSKVHGTVYFLADWSF